MITDELLKELEQKEKAATPGPWEIRSYLGHVVDGVAVEPDVVNTYSGFDLLDDAELTTAMRNALPDLLAEVRRLRAENAALREAVRPLVEAYNNDTGVTNGLLWASEYLDASTYRTLLAARAAADALEGLLDA